MIKRQLITDIWRRHNYNAMQDKTRILYVCIYKCRSNLARIVLLLF